MPTFGDHVLRFLWDIAGAGDFVIMPRNSELPHDANRLLLLARAEQEEHLWDPRTTRQLFHIRLVSSLDEFRAALTTQGGPMDLSTARPRNAGQRTPRPDDVAFVNECMDRYFARLPDELRSGVALPRRYDIVGYHRSYLIPWEMWDGRPDDDGYVRWQRLTIRPQAYSPAHGHGTWRPHPGPAHGVPPVASGRPHVAARRITILAAAGDSYILQGAEDHHHLMNPRLLLAERASFEKDESVRLPEVYARFLMDVGNGGIGPWWGLERAEHSSPCFDYPHPPDVGRLGRPFPHRRAFYPELKGAHTVVHLEDLSPQHIQGTVLLARAPGKTLRLVVSGPERGHVWADERQSVRGLHPVVRGGPYSFLAWYEQALDGMLAAAGPAYDEHASDIRRMFELDAKEKAKVRTPDSAFLQRFTDDVFGELIWDLPRRQWTGRLEIGARAIAIELDPGLNPNLDEQRQIIAHWRRVDDLRAAEPELRRQAAADTVQTMLDCGAEIDISQEEFAAGIELERIWLANIGVLHYRDPGLLGGDSIAIYINADLSYDHVEIG